MKSSTLPILLLLLWSSNIAIARTVDATQAQQIATTQLRTTNPTKGISFTRLTLAWTGSPIVKAVDGAPFYLFTEENGGFALIAGDDRAYPILAYNNKGSFDPLTMPTHVASWINRYRVQIEWLKNNPDYTNPQATELWNSYLSGTIKSTVLKKINTPTWDQGDPYFRFTPTINNGGTITHCLTGCVATGIGIFMRATSNQATQITGGVTIAYTQTSPTASISRTLPTSYDFAQMPYSINGTTTENEKNAIANLLADCGAVVQMHYDIGASSSTMTKAANGMINHFGYDKSTLYYDRNYYAGSWNQLLTSEIDNNRPVMYAGQDPTYGGHFFILDGYTNDSPTLFSINFGWSGSANGYYSLDAITPSGSPYNFSSFEQAIVRATPAVEGSKYKLNTTLIPYTINNVSTTGLEASTSTIVKNALFSIKPFCFINNTLKDPISAEIQIWHVNNNNQLIEKIASASNNFSNNNIYQYLFGNIKISQTINSGDKIRAYIICSNTDVESGPIWIEASPGAHAEIQLSPTATDEITPPQAAIYTSGFHAIIEGESFIGQEAFIYNLRGGLVQRVQINRSRTEILLTPGTYLIRIGQQSTKIIL